MVPLGHEGLILDKILAGAVSNYFRLLGVNLYGWIGGMYWGSTIYPIVTINTKRTQKKIEITSQS